LTDYGLAKGPADFTLTQSGVTIGTPQYISPEQARDPAGVDIQTDLYSLGATAYHMLTGVPPHTSETLAGLLTKVLYEKPRTARQVNARVSPGASFLVEKLMAKQKRYRYRTPREVVRDLRALESGRSIVPRNWAGDFEVHEVRRRYRRWASMAAASVVIAAGGLFWNQRLNEQELLELRERAAVADLDDLQNRSRPADKLEWQAYVGELERLRREHPQTTLTTRVPDLVRDAEKHIQFHQEYERYRHEALEHQSAGQFVKAIRMLDSYEKGFEEAGLYGARPLQLLQRLRSKIEENGIEAAELRVDAARAMADGLTVEPGVTETVERLFVATRAEILDVLVVNEGVKPLANLDEVLGQLRRARGVLNDAYLARYWAEKDPLLKAGEFATLLSILDAARSKIEADQDLKLMLLKIPSPAQKDLQSIDFRERDFVRSANEKANEIVLVKSQPLAEDRSYDEALTLLEGAVARSAEDLRTELQEGIDRIHALRLRHEREAASRVRDLYATLLQDLGRRDYFQARNRLESAAQDVAETGSALVTAVDQGQRLVAMLEELAFNAVRRRVVEGVDFDDGLRFGVGQPHPRVWNVRLKRSSAGDDILVFDAPGQEALEGYLHELSLDLLLRYAGLELPRTDEQFLANAALQIVEGGLLKRNEVERAHSNLLKVDGARLGLESVVEALGQRSRMLVDDKVRTEKNQETLAATYYARAEKRIAEGRANEALIWLDNLLSGTLSATEFVRNRRDDIETQRKAALLLLEEQRIEGLYPGALVREGERTTIEWTFSTRRELQGFLPPDDGKVRLYRVMPDDAGSIGNEPPLDPDQPFEGHLQFIKAPPVDEADEVRRRVHDSPLSVQSPFRAARYASVSFNFTSDDPLYLQVSMWGNHIGVLTDDGRRMGGRGVYAWQSEDWRNADSVFPDNYRHDYLKRNPHVLEEHKDTRYFQFEKGVTYRVNVVWDRKRITLRVDGREVWRQTMKRKYFRTRPEIVRIVTYTPCRIDNLVMEGVIDQQLLKRLLKRRRPVAPPPPKKPK
jgi:hypothetical protein